MTLSRDVYLHPADAPDVEALPLVLVHGYLGGSAQWAELEAGLAGRFQTVALDLPGFGRASGHAAPTTIGGFAEKVIADLDAKGMDRFNLVGHSMGGMIVQEVARRIAPRIGRLVLYGTGRAGSSHRACAAFKASAWRQRKRRRLAGACRPIPRSQRLQSRSAACETGRT